MLRKLLSSSSDTISTFVCNLDQELIQWPLWMFQGSIALRVAYRSTKSQVN